jgi:hypothetical protein
VAICELVLKSVIKDIGEGAKVLQEKYVSNRLPRKRLKSSSSKECRFKLLKDPSVAWHPDYWSTDYMHFEDEPINSFSKTGFPYPHT